MSEEPVDVLIIGAGASGAALAWSLAETRMNILCLEQGDWMNPAEYPGHARATGRRASSATSRFSPNARGRREDYPVNDGGSPIQASMFNAVGGSTILYAAHFPRFHPSRLPRPDARRRRRRLAARLPRARAVLRRQRAHDGRLGAGRRSRLSAEGACRCRRWRSASSARRWRAASTRSAGTGGRRTARSRRASTKAARRASTPAPACSAARRAPRRSTDITYWPAGAAPGRAPADALPGARDHRRRERHGRRRHLLRRRGRRAPAEGARRGASPATASARRGCCSTRARSSSPTGSPTAAGWSART